MGKYDGYLRQYAIIDPATGEVVSQTTYTYHRPPDDDGRGWGKLYQMTMRLLAISDKFAPADIRVYLYIASCVGYDCKYSASQGAIAKQIGLSRQQVNVSIKSLREKDLIRENIDENGLRTYYLNPYWITRGNKKTRDQIVATYNEIPYRDTCDPEYRRQVAEVERMF